MHSMAAVTVDNVDDTNGALSLPGCRQVGRRMANFRGRDQRRHPKSQMIEYNHVYDTTEMFSTRIMTWRVLCCLGDHRLHAGDR